MKSIVTRLIAFLTALVLVVSLVPPSNAYADKGAGMKEAMLLTPGEAVAFTTGTETVNTYWYKMERTTSSMTHMEITLEASKLTNISVYPSADMAAKDETFDRYRASATQEGETQTAKIQLPYAWEGPYYIKLEYMPMMDEMPIEEGIEEGVPEEEGSEEQPTEPGMPELASDIRLVYNPVKLPVKYEETSGDMCAVESILQPAPDRDSTLKVIRRIQKEVLGKSGEGRELSALYYRASPYLVRAVAFDQSSRQQAYADLKTLKPLLAALADKKSYTVTKGDAVAINRMYQFVVANVPDGLKADIEALADTVGMTSLAGTSLTDLFGKVGMNIQTVDSDRYIVKYKTAPTRSLGKLNALSAVSADRINIGRPGDHFAIVNVENASTKMQAAAASALKADANVEYFEPVQTYQAFGTDVNYNYQWSLNEKSLLKPFKGSGVGLERYEQFGLSGKAVKVAVLDTGVDYRLLDLKGKVDIANEKNFVDTNGEGDAIDDHGHGTHVAGVIAAARDNGVSMKGMVSNVSILPVKVLDASGSGDTDQIALGIKYAVDAGAKVINLSLGGSESRTMGYMLKYAHDRGVVVLAATGNDGASRVSYPASSKYTISVGATNTFGLVSDYSNYGVGVDIVAPGSKIASLVPDGNVVYMDGTSMATPHVSAVVALLLSNHPQLGVEQVRTLLRRTADQTAFSGGDAPKDPREGDGLEYVLDELDVPLLPYYNLISGYGKVNVHRAESMLRLNATSSQAYDNRPTVSFKVKTGTVVSIYRGSKRLATSTARDGKVTLKVGAHKTDSVLRVIYRNGKYETGERLIVATGARATKPNVIRPNSGAKQIVGKAQAGMTVVVRDASKRTIGQAVVNLDGTFTAKTRTLKKGERLSIHVIDAKKQTSPITYVFVK